MSYTQIFGGTTIYPSDVSYLALSLTGDNQFTFLNGLELLHKVSLKAA